MSDFVRLRRTLPAEIGRVFDAWSRADALSRWLSCTPDWTSRATSDFRVGGRYRVEMTSGGRVVGVAFGEYLEIEPPRRLVFSWTSEGRIGVRDSVVTIELRPVGRATELELTHDLAPDSDEGRAHAWGWNGSLAALTRYLEETP